MNRLYDAQLNQSGVAHTFRVYPGGHTWALWQSQAPNWLALALAALGAEAKHRGGGGGGASVPTR